MPTIDSFMQLLSGTCYKPMHLQMPRYLVTIITLKLLVLSFDRSHLSKIHTTSHYKTILILSLFNNKKNILLFNIIL